MHLLKTYFFIISLWRQSICKESAFERMREHAVGSICSLGRGSVSNLVVWLGRDQQNPSSDYRVYSDYKWKTEDLFDPLLKQTLPYFNDKYVVVGADDTRIRKTGKKIPGTCWGPDRMGPKFQVNLIWSQRYLQFSCLLPLHEHNASSQPRAIPIRFIHAPPLKKPGKRASIEEQKKYKEQVKTHNLSTLFKDEVKKLRKSVDAQGAADKRLLMVGDGSFCNRICMSIKDDGVEMLARTRKNARLCFADQSESRRIYAKEKFTPEQVRKDDTTPWQSVKVFYGAQWRELQYKKVDSCLWQSGTKTQPLKLLVLAPLPYVKGGKRNYRDPAYLLCTDSDAPAQFLIQSYLNRWQIEVNFREEKSIFGLGQAQVRNANSVQKQPAFLVAAYSALLLSSIIAYDDQPHQDFGEQPIWRPPPQRPTARALVGLMRKAIIENPTSIFELGMTKPMIAAIFAKAA